MSLDRSSEAKIGFRSTFRPLVDDRGQRIQRINRNDLKRAARSENPGLAMLANRLRVAMKSESRRYTPDRVLLTVVLVFAVLIANGLIGGLLMGQLGARGSLFSLGVFVGLIVVATKVYQTYIRRGALTQIAKTAVAEGVCGSCAFSLEGTPTDDDGALTCPECGARWDAQRVVAPFWSRPVVPVLRRSFLAWLAPGVRAPNGLFTPDDRGRYVPCPDSRLIRLRRDLIEPIPPHERRELIRGMRRVGRWWRAGLTLALAWMPGAMIYVAWRIWTDDPASGVWFFVILVLPILMCVLLVPFSSAFGGPDRTARVLVRRGRCGSCLEPIPEMERDGEGRGVCPRCGAAWMLPEPTSQEVS